MDTSGECDADMCERGCVRVKRVCFNETVTWTDLPLLDEHIPREHAWQPASAPQAHARAGGERGWWLMNETARRAAGVAAEEEARQIEERFERTLRLIVHEGTCLFTATRLDSMVRATPGTTMSRAAGARELLAEMEAAKLAAMLPIRKRSREPEDGDGSCGERAVSPCLTLRLPSVFLPQTNGAAMALRAIG